MAHKGDLVSIFVDGEEVGARLGYSYVRDKVRYFAAWRFGYPRRVFSDPERYGAINGMNSYLAIQHAHQSGHDVLDFGLAPAHPIENGQLRFKRMRGCAVSTVNCHFFFSVRMPRGCGARFFWARPLFSVEGQQVALNVGIPADVTDRDLVDRIRRELMFKGVSLLRLHTERPVSKTFEESIRARWGSAGGVGLTGGQLLINIVPA
jgi:hypothetical protein